MEIKKSCPYIPKSFNSFWHSFSGKLSAGQTPGGHSRTVLSPWTLQTRQSKSLTCCVFIMRKLLHLLFTLMVFIIIFSFVLPTATDCSGLLTSRKAYLAGASVNLHADSAPYELPLFLLFFFLRKIGLGLPIFSFND